VSVVFCQVEVSASG